MKPHKLPKQEDVDEVRVGPKTVVVIRATDENREAIVEMALSMYLGEGCKYCPRIFETLEDVKDTVWAGFHERGRLACKSCWDANNPSAGSAPAGGASR